MIFLNPLLKFLKSEDSFKIQIFTLESLELFENFLKSQNIKYSKSFTSSYAKKDELILLLADSENFEIKSSKLILYSNNRDRRFIPYKFILTSDEKRSFVTDFKLFEQNKFKLFEQNKNLSLASILRKEIDVGEYISGCLTYLEKVVLFCMANESRFSKLASEISAVDESLKNRYLIRMALNRLVKFKIIKKNGFFYKINVSKSTIEKICESIGFGLVFKQ